MKNPVLKTGVWDYISPPIVAISHHKKKELTAIAKNPYPGILRAFISGSLQYTLRLEVNRSMFDRKLLEYLHEQGVRSMLGIIIGNELF